MTLPIRSKDVVMKMFQCKLAGQVEYHVNVCLFCVVECGIEKCVNFFSINSQSHIIQTHKITIFLIIWHQEKNKSYERMSFHM